MAGASAATRRCAPSRFTSTVWAKSLGEVRSAVPGSAWPALDTMMSTGPTISVATRANSSTDDASARSRRCTWASPPASLMPVATASHGCTRRAPRTTRWPAAASAAAVAAPIPDEAPATIAPRRSGWATKRRRGTGRDPRSAGRDGGGEAGEAPHVDGVHPTGALGVDVVVGHAGHELLEDDARLESGQGGAQAEVAATPEADELGGVAPEVVAIGLLEDLGVAVGRSHEQQHALAVAEFRAQQLHFARCHP